MAIYRHIRTRVGLSQVTVVNSVILASNSNTGHGPRTGNVGSDV